VPPACLSMVNHCCHKSKKDNCLAVYEGSNDKYHDQPHTSHPPPPPAGDLGRGLGGTPPGGTPALSMLLLVVGVVSVALRVTTGPAMKQPQLSHLDSWNVSGTAQLPAGRQS
jgi:hypothetical protein